MATAIEYGLVAALITVAAITGADYVIKPEKPPTAIVDGGEIKLSHYPHDGCLYEIKQDNKFMTLKNTDPDDKQCNDIRYHIVPNT